MHGARFITVTYMHACSVSHESCNFLGWEYNHAVYVHDGLASFPMQLQKSAFSGSC